MTNDYSQQFDIKENKCNVVTIITIRANRISCVKVLMIERCRVPLVYKQQFKNPLKLIIIITFIIYNKMKCKYTRCINVNK